MRIGTEGKSQVGGMALALSALGWQRWEDPWTLVTSQLSLIVDPQVTHTPRL